MKRTVFTILLFGLLTFSIHAQTKPTRTPVPKPSPQKNQTVTTKKAVTENGKAIIVKSNGTWEYAPVQVSEQSTVKACELTLKDAPVIKGLKLGMNKDELESVFRVPSSDKNIFDSAREYRRPDGVEEYSFHIPSYRLRFPDEFWNIDTLKFGFFEDELYTIQVTYSKQSAIFTEEEFKAKIIESFKLPLSGWSKSVYVRGGGSYYSGAELKCAEFELKVFEGNLLILTNLNISRKIEDSEERKRETFKP